MSTFLPAAPARSHTLQTLWAALLVVGCLCASTVFACATPFAALATLAALKCSRRDALLLMAMAWLANQAVGFGLLHYPGTWDTVAWGGAIGVATWAGVLAACAVPMLSAAPLYLASAFLTAFASYELVLYAANFVLPGGEAGFTPQVIMYVLEMNVLGLAILWAAFLALNWLSARIRKPAHSLA